MEDTPNDWVFWNPASLGERRFLSLFFGAGGLGKHASAKNGGILYGAPIFWQMDEPEPTHIFNIIRSQSLRRLSARASLFRIAERKKEPPRLTAQEFPPMVILFG